MFWFHRESTPETEYPAPPRMPRELERYIVEMYALESAGPERILQLLPVCHRVRFWLEPALYRTLILNDGADEQKLPSCQMDAIERLWTNHPGALQAIVRNVMLIGETRDTVERVLRSCNSAENVFLAGCATGGLDLSLLSPSLQRLHCTAETLDLLNWKPGGYTIASLTHLELFTLGNRFDRPVSHALLRLLDRQHFPNLAHLALSATSVIRSLPEILPRLRNLKSLVIVSAYRLVSSTPLSEEDRRILMEHERLVLVSVPDYTEDWQDGVLSGNDYWARAERRISNRLSGVVDGESLPHCFGNALVEAYLQATHYAVNFDELE
ncbi:unnamed protein product [Mycena citricolor]|uniref:Uncharacterized protein n=1 Tax=Mycena citricolor TaxID=2018698 RepID=A0AAD2HCM6_9AGAR|nr:unnamed protein product [Mycena citricolor]